MEEVAEEDILLLWLHLKTAFNNAIIVCYHIISWFLLVLSSHIHNIEIESVTELSLTSFKVIRCNVPQSKHS